MALTPGQTLGSYRIVEQLGRGGMATVYRAYQPSLDREVAIKVLPESFSEDEVARARFHREAVTVANLNHPNILKLHDFGEEDGVSFLVSELVAGGALSNRLDGPLPPEEVVKYLAPIASALDYAHARGVLHRDLKPSNILLTADGTPVLADFGLALMMSSHTRLTHTGVGVGTPEYMAPEQGKGEEGGKEADLYSLAVIAYEMLTGQVPFSAETPLAVLLAHINKPLPLPRDVNDTLNEAVETVLLKGLAKDPSDRFSSASEFINALATAAGASFPVETEASSGWFSWRRLTALRQRRGRAFLVGAGAAIAVALLVPGVASLYFMSGEKENAASDEQESAANTTTSSDQGTVGELTTVDYVNEVEADWSLFNAKFEALREELSDFSYVTKDRLFETLTKHGAGTFYVDTLAAIEALEPPETYERDHQILVEGLEELVRLDKEAGKAVEERDLVGFALADRRLVIEERTIAGRLSPLVCKQLVFPIFCRRAGTLPGGLYGEDLERTVRGFVIRWGISSRVTNWPSFEQAASNEDVRQFRIAYLQELSLVVEDTIARLSAMQPPEEFQEDHRLLIELITGIGEEIPLYVWMWRGGPSQESGEMDQERDEAWQARFCDARSQLSDDFRFITRAFFDGLRMASTCDSR